MKLFPLPAPSRRGQFSLAELLLLFIPVAIGARFPALLPLLIGGTAWLLARRHAPDGAPYRRFRFLIPGAWGANTWVSFHHPGDEYGLFGVGALPAVWLIYIAAPQKMMAALAPIIAGGMASLFLAGWALDVMRARLTAWAVAVLLLTAALVTWSIASFPSYDRALAKNGSLTAYVSGALNVSLYVVTGLSLGLVPLSRAVRNGWRRG